MKNKTQVVEEIVPTPSEPDDISIPKQEEKLEKHASTISIVFPDIVERHFKSKEAFNAFYNIKE